MKQHTFFPIFFVMFFLTQSSFAQNLTLLATVSSEMPADLSGNRPADFPNLGKYLHENLHYPVAAQKSGIEGQITVEAIINEEGEVASVKLVKGIGFGCDEVVMELVSNMPKWIPAQKNGQHVPQKAFIRVRFRLK